MTPFGLVGRDWDVETSLPSSIRSFLTMLPSSSPLPSRSPPPSHFGSGIQSVRPNDICCLESRRVRPSILTSARVSTPREAADRFGDYFVSISAKTSAYCCGRQKEAEMHGSAICRGIRHSSFIHTVGHSPLPTGFLAYKYRAPGNGLYEVAIDY